MRVILEKWSIAALLILSTACGKSDLSDSQPHLDAPSPVQPIRVEITQLSAEPQSVRPGQSVLLSVSISPADVSSSRYAWQATDGSFSDAQTNPASWTAPATGGNFIVTVDAWNKYGAARGYLSVFVAVSPPSLLVSSVSPAEAQAGDLVKVHGYGFGTAQGDGTVSIGGATATDIISWSDSQIEVRVPSAASTGDVSVTVGGSSSNTGKVVVLWPTTDPQNLSVTSVTSEQRSANLIQDGAGGSLVVWQDARNGNADVFAQRIGKTGERLWSSEGRPVTEAAGTQKAPKLASDGANGAIVVWEDYRDGAADIYAQRITADGNAAWTAGGVALVTAVGDQLAPQIVVDGSGGAIVVWEDHRGGNGDIYAQRIDANGVVQWAADGVAVSATAEHQFSPRLVAGPAGAAFIVWEDFRSGNDYDIYAQQLGSAGTPAWTSDGVVVSAATRNQLAPQVIADGSSGAIVAWEDHRGTGADIYAQRIDSTGMATWTANGLVISAAANNQRAPRMVADEAGGAFVAWEDYRNGNADVFAQHVNALGVRQWAANGAVVNASSSEQLAPRLVPDRAGGIIVAWSVISDNGDDVFVQRLSRDGSPLWTTDALAVCSATGDQSAVRIIEDGAQGAVVIWTDSRESLPRIFAQGISASGRQ